MDRSASAVWHGTVKEGKGTISTQSGTLKEAQYSFSTRFENGVGTNPEELIAAAHAGCFTMALSAQLTDAGLKPETLETTAVVTLGQDVRGSDRNQDSPHHQGSSSRRGEGKVQRSGEESQGGLSHLATS